MAPLLQTGAFRCHDDIGVSALRVDGGNQSALGNRGDVNPENVLQDPATLVEKQVDRPKTQLVDGGFDRPIIQRLPTEIDKVETQDKDNENANIHHASVFRIAAVFLYACFGDSLFHGSPLGQLFVLTAILVKNVVFLHFQLKKHVRE